MYPFRRPEQGHLHQTAPRRSNRARTGRGRNGNPVPPPLAARGARYGAVAVTSAKAVVVLPLAPTVTVCGEIGLLVKVRSAGPTSAAVYVPAVRFEKVASKVFGR